MRRLWIVFLAVSFTATLEAAKPATPAKPAAPAKSATPAKRAAPAASAPDSSIGLSRTSVFAVPEPPLVAPPAGAPGERPRYPRAFPGAPPRIPHAIQEFLPITREQNACFECHHRANAPESGAVPIPASHYRDTRRAPMAEREQIAGARQVCVSCHVPQTEAPPLVGNRFGQ